MDPTIIVIQDYDVVLTTDNIDYEGPALPFIGGLLLGQVDRNTFITGINLYPCLARINNIFQNCVRGWIFRISPRGKLLRIGQNNICRGTFFVDYIAIDYNNNGKQYKRKRIDIINLDLLHEKPPRYPHEQLTLTEDIIKLQRDRGLKWIRQTKGSIGSALMKASPNWEKNRHAAPLFINRFSRKHLPGNFYSLSNKASTEGPGLADCYYLDQNSAHLSISLTSCIPHPHYIRARGYFREAMQKRKHYPVWTTPRNKIGSCIVQGHYNGLILAKIHCSHLPPTKEHLYPLWARKRGSKYIWLWTPELRLFSIDFRLQLDSFVAGFTTNINDPIINEYGAWALNWLRNNGRNRQYTKPILLAALGMLAFNQEKYPAVRRFWGGSVKGNKVNLPEAGTVSEREIKLNPEIQNKLINVIARGVIEAETKVRSIEYARELDEQGFHIVQIYVDGLVVQGVQLPFIKKGWRLQTELSNVLTPHPNWLLSKEMIKTPGQGHTDEWDRNYQEKLNKARAPFSALQDRLDKLTIT